MIPAVGAVTAILAGFGIVALDHATEARLGFQGDAEAARSILSTIAAAMITFTGLVFSITIVALQLASAQFSPRVMRTFLRDRTSKLALATFVATFGFAFTVMRSTRADSVPGISVTIAIVLVFASTAVFIYYINHTAHAIRAVAIIDSVGSETRQRIEALFPLEPPAHFPEPDLTGDHIAVTNDGDPGVIIGFDSDRIVSAASEQDAVVVLHAGVGDFVPTGAPLYESYGTASLCDVSDFISLGQERTMQQDAAFGLRQLVDLASKALSPGINDPTTAGQAIDQIHDLLRRLVMRPLEPGRAADAEGAVRLVFPAMGWADYVALAVDEIRIYGAGSLQVMRQLHEMLEDLLALASDERRPPLREQLVLLAAASERELVDARDRRFLGSSPG